MTVVRGRTTVLIDDLEEGQEIVRFGERKGVGKVDHK